MNEEQQTEKEFKVVDRRSASRSETPPADTAPKQPPKDCSGEGFVMKDSGDAPGAAATPAQIDFATLIFSLATGALINLGLAPDPTTQQVQKNLDLAKQNIEILEMLQAKTKGNLTAEEDRILESLLTEVRLKYVEAVKTK